MKSIKFIAYLFLCFLSLSSIVYAYTEVTSITASPNPFNNFVGETTTITVNATPGVTDLEIRVLSSDETVVVRSGLTLSEISTGVYTTIWNGRDNSNAMVVSGNYVLRVFNLATTTYIGPSSMVTVQGLATSVTPSNNIFTPTGTNSVLITVQATPGQSGLKVEFYNPQWGSWCGPNWNCNLPLTETSTPGVYTASWNAVDQSRGYVVPNGQYTIFVYDAANNKSTTTGQITISGVSSVSASPTQFTPGGNNFTTIIAKGATGLNLQLKIFNNTTNVLTRTLPMTEASGTYTAEWDGKDNYGNFAGANTYRLRIYNTGSDVSYSPQSSVVVNVAVFSISASPDPFVPTGNNEVTITVRADKG